MPSLFPGSGGAITCDLLHKEVSISHDATTGKTTYSVPFLLFGNCTENDIIRAVGAEVNASFGAYPEKISSLKQEGPFVYRATAEFSVSSDASNPGGNSASSQKKETEFSWEATGEKVKVYTARQTMWRANEDTEETLGIGYDPKTKTFRGCDALAPTQATSAKAYIPVSQFDERYQRMVASLVGKVNDDKFLGWSPGELLFTGASASWKKSDAFVAVLYRFSLSPNDEFFKVDPMTSKKQKKGWWYVWYYMEEDKSVIAEGKLPSENQKVKNVYCQRIYEAKKFKEIKL